MNNIDTIPERPSPSASMYLDRSRIEDDKAKAASETPKRQNIGFHLTKGNGSKVLTRNMGREQISSTPSSEDCKINKRKVISYSNTFNLSIECKNH